ncbi:MAG: amidohydrolase family protein [Acetobacteraceae bacterium]
MSGAIGRAGGWDVHTHIIPPDVIAAAETGRYGMTLTGGKLGVCGHGVPLLPISDVTRLLDRLHADGLDGAIVSVPPPLFRPDLSRAEGRDYTRLVNDGLLRACRIEPNALRPLAYLPGEDPELAAELAGQLGSEWAGAVMGTAFGNGLSYAHPGFDPLWQILSDARLPLFIHPGATPDRRLDHYYLANLLGNPVETTIAAANLLFSGVIYRFPRLTVILAHGGGALAALIGRWQRGVETARPGIPAMPAAPLAAVQRFYIDSLFHSAPFRDAAISIIGIGRVLLGSDWPFPMGAPTADHDLAGLDPDLRRRIRKDNCEGAFGLRLHA